MRATVKDSKRLDIFFRACIFITFAVTSVSATIYVYLFVTRLTHGRISTSEIFNLIDELKIPIKLYDVMLVGALLCLILSVAAGYNVRKIHIIGRTYVILGCAVSLIFGRTVLASFIKIMEVLRDSGADISTMTNEKALDIMTDSGMSLGEAKDLIDKVDDPSRISSLFYSYIGTMFWFFVLSLTSLKHLLKKDNRENGGDDFIRSEYEAYRREENNKY